SRVIRFPGGATMRIQETTTGDIACLAVAGSLDLFTHTTLRRHVDRLLEQGHSHLQLDLGETERLDVTGLGSLVSVVRKLRDRQGSLRIVAASKPVERILHLVNIRCLLPICPS
ncbi:MAG: STAS domain-containing protein, partial [Candidatus Eremiobacterota bacterium]